VYTVLVTKDGITVTNEQVMVLSKEGTVTVKNHLIAGSLEISKVDETDGNIVLPGAEFTIYDEQGTEVVKGKTGEEGIAKFEKLPYGKYTYKETIAPDGYLINGETF
ncbi:prealbumin-like fold domain-containing protein, partial [Bacillus cereus]|uniref:prealbumin-like fold domain-containing protein n=1 Tax=Bacillus cereus TaxID=1396 RepID=UPI0015D4F2BE